MEKKLNADDMIAHSMEQHEKNETRDLLEILIMPVFLLAYINVAAIIHAIDASRPYQATLIAILIGISAFFQLSSCFMKIINDRLVWFNKAYIHLFFIGLLIHIIMTAYAVFIVSPIFNTDAFVFVWKFVLPTWIVLSSSFIFLIFYIRRK